MVNHLRDLEKENDYLRRQINIMRKKKQILVGRRKMKELVRKYHNLRLQKLQAKANLARKRYKTSRLKNEYSRTFRLHRMKQIALELAIFKECLASIKMPLESERQQLRVNRLEELLNC